MYHEIYQKFLAEDIGMRFDRLATKLLLVLICGSMGLITRGIVIYYKISLMERKLKLKVAIYAARSVIFVGMVLMTLGVVKLYYDENMDLMPGGKRGGYILVTALSIIAAVMAVLQE